MKNQFKNPNFDSYKQLKEFVLSPCCKWTYTEETIPPSDDGSIAVSYTHLTLPTKA